MDKAQFIELSAFPRRAQFLYFREMAFPYVGVTVDVEMTAWLDRQKREGRPFFLSFLYEACRAANAVPEMRQRIRGERIVAYDACGASYTVALPDGTYGYCNVDTDRPLSSFLPYAQARQALAMAMPTLDDSDDAERMFFISTLPWIAYSALVQPTPNPPDSNPRITWGRYRLENGRVVMPVSLLCHHALVDGIHLARFFEALNDNLAENPRRCDNF